MARESERRQALKRAYKERRPEMGVFEICCSANQNRYFGVCRDFKADVNSHFMRLSGGMHRDKQLSEDYRRFGEGALSARLVEALDCGIEKDDYSEELQTLLLLLLEQHPGVKRIEGRI